MIRVLTPTTMLLALRLAVSAWATVTAATAKGPAMPEPARIEASTAPAVTADTIYTGDGLRDPFSRWGASHGPARAFSLENFSIHKIFLRGIMKDAGSDFALFVDNEAGASLILRKGRLYGPRKKLIPGVSGAIDFKKKMVTLTAPEGDVQVFQLGEAGKD